MKSFGILLSVSLKNTTYTLRTSTTVIDIYIPKYSWRRRIGSVFNTLIGDELNIDLALVYGKVYNYNILMLNNVKIHYKCKGLSMVNYSVKALPAVKNYNDIYEDLYDFIYKKLK